MMGFIVSYKIILLICCFISGFIGIKIGEYLKHKEVIKMIEEIQERAEDYGH